VIRPKTDEFHDFRGYAGKVSSGFIKPGDLIEALPSKQISKIKSILKAETSLEIANPGESVVLTLEDDIDISRGDMIVKVGEGPEIVKSFSAQVCWMDSNPLIAGKNYLIQHGTNRQKTKVSGIGAVMNVEIMEESSDSQDLKLNQIGIVDFRFAGFVYPDKYEVNPANGAFIIIDEFSNNTVGVGFVI